LELKKESASDKLNPMGSSAELRFQPNDAAKLFLELAGEHSVQGALQKLVAQVGNRPGLACLQVWCLGDGDQCPRCPLRDPCGDHRRCLHLAAGRGISVRGGSEAPSYFSDPNARIPLGYGLLGKAASNRQPLILPRMTEEDHKTVGVGWTRQERVRGVVIGPIVFKGETLGVLIGYLRRDIGENEDSQSWNSIICDHIAAVMVSAQAFEEIQRLKAQLELHNTYLQEEVIEAKAHGDLVGQSGVLRQLISQIDLVAPTEASVLILGETGTGKELVAHEIHRRSERKRGPLVRVNCASIPRELFESELFGHVRGSFTGAIKDRAGRVETAEKGTLFLDEIGDLPLDLQSKLLRFLQEKKYERIGDDRTRHADVRVIGATNRDLKKAIAAGRFREDLYFRLHVFPIQVPSLRERKEDIPLLANHFVNLSVRDLKCAKPRLTRAAVTELQNYDWPGNVRELRNVIERAVILARGGTLSFDLPTSGAPASSPRPALQAQVPEGDNATPKLLTEAELRSLERDNILATLQAAKWRVRGPDGAAELLGVKPTTLYSRLQKLGIKPPDTIATIHQP
jgi:transcriptional regulator with GAF, ATPase, and Fis domain